MNKTTHEGARGFVGGYKLAMGISALFLFLLLLPATAFADNTYSVKVDSGYLALRTAPAYDYSNEIGELYTGDTVTVTASGTANGKYWWVYSPKLGKSGYVNADYLVGGGSYSTPAVSSSSGSYTVQVATGYLALRTAPAYDYSNEIGELYTGDTVTVTASGTANGKYWWVYSPKLGKSGYVNADYLVGGGSYSTPAVSSSSGSYTVQVATGYLALRTAPAYDYSNEIGELYTGDTVTVTASGTANGKYWWVYSPKLGKSGYVNADYLVGGGSYSTPAVSSSSGSYTVQVATGYLALRTAPAYDYSNEIGELYTGDTVTVSGSTSGQYWWVYSPKHGKSGYVNKDYLV